MREQDAKLLWRLSRAQTPHAFDIIKSNERLRYVLVPALLSNVGIKAKWKFPKQRNDLYNQRNVVYFVTANTMPGQIKIGRTGRLVSRTKALGKEYHSDNEPLSPLAFIRCASRSESMLIEKAFHCHFDYARGVGEWFDIQVVTGWMIYNVHLAKYQHGVPLS